MAFQKDGVRFGLRTNGRCLIGDEVGTHYISDKLAKCAAHQGVAECGCRFLDLYWMQMGLGKTMQAIGIVAHYHEAFPLLVVVPASVKFSWAAEIEKWTTIPAHKIKLVRSRSDLDSVRNSQVITHESRQPQGNRPVSRSVIRFKFRVMALNQNHTT